MAPPTLCFATVGHICYSAEFKEALILRDISVEDGPCYQQEVKGVKI